MTHATLAKAKGTIGIDIGGTKINASRITLLPEATDPFIFGGEQRLSTPQTGAEFIHTLLTMVEQLIIPVEGGAVPDVSSIGIATAGIVDPVQGMILGSTGNLPAIEHHPFDLRTPLFQKFGVPVYVENDANAAAYGECKAGAARGYQNVLMVTLGTGVGTGLVFNGRLYHGGRFCAGEGGHITISMNHERQWTTGLYDSWEAYASGPGLAVTARKMVGQNPNTPAAIDLIGDEPVDSLSTHQVIHAWKAGNELAKEIMTRWHEHIAAGLGGLINLLDPDISVIGGGMAQFVDFDLLRECLKARVMNCPISQLKVVPAILGNQAGVIGAAFLAQELAQ